MQLRTARLCLDCEEVHDAQVCPVCASETFAFLSRWVPAPAAARRRPKPQPPEQADVYRQLIEEASAPSTRRGGLLKKGLIGLTAVGVVGWLWGSRQAPGAANRKGDEDRAD